MSRIFLVLVKRKTNHPSITNQIEQYCRSHGIGVFFTSNYVEPAVRIFLSQYYVCSLSDNFTYDNCENLLLPDGAVYNNHTNTISFINRMRIVRDLVAVIMEQNRQSFVHVFVGDSGEDYDDYHTVRIALDSFPFEIDKMCNCAIPEYVHFIISGTGDRTGKENT